MFFFFFEVYFSVRMKEFHLCTITDLIFYLVIESGNALDGVLITILKQSELSIIIIHTVQ